MNVPGYVEENRLTAGIAAVVVALAVLWAVTTVFHLPGNELFTMGMAQRSLQAMIPIALAAIGGLYAEKSGVFNIGLEGFMIFGAFLAPAIAWMLSGGGTLSQTELWAGLIGAVVVCTLLSVIFAVFTVRYKSNQIVAGLGVWFIGLGFAPFAATVIWGGVSSPPLSSINNISIPYLASIPMVGPLLFDATPFLLFTLFVAVVSWIVLNRTRYGLWIQAAGEDPEALFTAGIDVNRVRYATVIFSGALAGLGGAVLSIGIGSGFIGTGATIVSGRGWIAIVAYLFGNYNPIGTLLASFLFGAMNMLQIQLQIIGISLPSSIVNLFPYIGVIVVLAAVGYTRVPSAAGEPYEIEDSR